MLATFSVTNSTTPAYADGDAIGSAAVEIQNVFRDTGRVSSQKFGCSR